MIPKIYIITHSYHKSIGKREDFLILSFRVGDVYLTAQFLPIGLSNGFIIDE